MRAKTLKSPLQIYNLFLFELKSSYWKILTRLEKVGSYCFTQSVITEALGGCLDWKNSVDTMDNGRISPHVTSQISLVASVTADMFTTQTLGDLITDCPYHLCFASVRH